MKKKTGYLTIKQILYGLLTKYTDRQYTWYNFNTRDEWSINEKREVSLIFDVHLNRNSQVFRVGAEMIFKLILNSVFLLVYPAI